MFERGLTDSDSKIDSSLESIRETEIVGKAQSITDANGSV